MKIFISQPMRGKTDAEILAERERAIKAAKAKWGDDVEVLESFFQGAPTEAKPLWFLGESLKVMADANAVIVCKGWSDARGCKVEIVAAEAYKLPVFFMIGNKVYGFNE
nr:MAG TPA: protein of unknown function (DUF4406) [Bacteriophage sp.]